VRVSSFVSIGPAVWPATRNIDHDRQTDKHIAFYYIDLLTYLVTAVTPHLQRRTFGDCCDRFLYRLDALPVAEPAASNYERNYRNESLTRHETSSTVCLRLCSDGSSIRYSTVTLNFDLLTPKFNTLISVT